MTFVPLLGRWLLRGQGGLHHDGAGRGFSLRGMDRLRAALLGSYRAVLAAGLRHPWKVLIVVHAVLVASLLLAPGLGRQFFPPAERNQMLVDITLPESSSLERTGAVCDRVFTLLQPHDEIVGGAIFGLLAGTVLTLFVLSVWYVVVVARRHAPPRAML